MYREVSSMIINIATSSWPSSSNEVTTEQNNKPGHVQEVNNMIISIVTSSWPSSSNEVTTEPNNKPGHVLLSPNLSTCHGSLTDEGRPIYCCPPKRESDEPFIDFQFPDNTSLVCIRRPAQKVDKEYIAKYSRALSIMKYLPYDDPKGMLIPDMYLNGSFYDSQRESAHLPPQVADINFDYVERGLGPEDQIEANIAFMYHQMVSGAKKTELFMGCPYKAGEEGFCDGPGTIELAPHNALHTWVGNTQNPKRENLGAFYSAAKDPVFYAHHANIDRLWDVWTGLRGNKAEINDPDWLDSYFYFYDEKSQNGQVPRPKTHRSDRTKKEKAEEEEILVVYGIEIKKDMYVKFDVFVNAVDETTIGPESREFAGTFVNVRRGVRIVMNKNVVTKRKTNLKLGISELLEDLEADEDERIWVTLVPRGGTCINTTVDGVRIEYMR
ncbi:hypothetical protein IFM89_007221 [Coptis chinensis]|uniref:Tyrosinase copper-binding domain-containing protein n=1 Tax=Coptis chinensis TaxID=261450 RepID=A0A835IMV8_9MAGN|nr:hypothetical protein IFM89_007221 [Coptis chinensis]